MIVGFRNRVDFRAITREVDRTSGKRLARLGYQMMRKAQGLIKNRRDRNRASRPGTPPYSHGYFKKSILYGVEGNTSVVIGPAYFKGNPLTNAARLHEFGGVKRLKGRRRQYAVGKVGPIDIEGWTSGSGRQTTGRADYVTPTHGRAYGVTEKGVAFVRLKTDAQVRRAQAIDRQHWRDADSGKEVTYPQRPYMSTALRMMEPRLTGFWVRAIKA